MKRMSVQKKKAAKCPLTQGVCMRSMKATFEDGIAPLLELRFRSQRKENQYPLLGISNLDDKWSHDKSEQSLVESTKKSRRKVFNRPAPVMTISNELREFHFHYTNSQFCDPVQLAAEV